MKVLYGRGAERPSESAPRAEQERPRAEPRAVIGGSADAYGACSVETFCDASGLWYTHEDAQGWLDYPTGFTSGNFWRKDASVQPWIYYEDYDNWQDTYGADAVLAFYHSGHGAMASNGVFQAPVGANWGGLGCRVYSDQMRLGNEQVRYIFWSTCLSLRVLDGHNPIRTWSPANLGFRMLFGFETVSWDDPNYGKYFWEEWKKGKSLSTSWLDASWRIATDQSPSVVAVGANQTEAQNRLYNERYLSWDAVSTSWWSWRWYYAARGARASREPSRALPRDLLIAQLRPPEVDEATVRNVVDQLGVDVPLPDEVRATRDGVFAVGDGEARVAFAGDGSFDARMAAPNLSNLDELPVSEARSVAQEAVRGYGLGRDTELVFDRVRRAATASGTNEGSGQIEGPFTTETTVEYRQVINGLPVISPSAGVVRVAVDNDGTVTSVHNSLREIDQLVDRPRNTAASPPEPGATSQDGPIARPRATDERGYEQLLAREWADRVAHRWVVRGEMPLSFTVVPFSREVGYDIQGNTAVVVAREAIEVDFGDGLRARYWVTVPLLD